MIRLISAMLTLSLLLASLCVSAYAESETPPEESFRSEGSAQAEDLAQSPVFGSVAALMQTALSQLEYEEAPSGYTKYGPLYGYPTGHWCDMFVSWCAQEEGIPESVFPISVSCTQHMKLFTQLERYFASPARGGAYIPAQGDLIFFYNYKAFPKGEQLRHVGLVLCVTDDEVVTVEGNTITNRLDYDSESVSALRRLSREPEDYVAVKRYPLNDPQIHGYASPLYADRTPLVPSGYVDLGKYEQLRETFEFVAEKGILPATSAYTFSPRYGMTRGEFIMSVMKAFDFPTDGAPAEGFADVSCDRSYFDAFAAARSMGLVFCDESGKYYPDRYVSGADAQAILTRALICAGMDELTFRFTEGDLSYLLTPYTIRADLAQALYTVYFERQRALRALPVPLFPSGGAPSSK